MFQQSPRRGKRRFLGNETRSWEVADVRLDEAAEHFHRTIDLFGIVYETYWRHLSEEARDPYGPELIDVFEGSLDPLTPGEHERLIMADAVKEAVSVVEVYLDDLSRHILPNLQEATPQSVLREAHSRRSFPRLISGLLDSFGLDLREEDYWPDWNELRATRHLLTHNWGRYNRKYFDDAKRQPDSYTPRLPEDPWLPRDATEAERSTEPIALDKLYVEHGFKVARQIIDEVETTLGSDARNAGLDWFS